MISEPFGSVARRGGAALGLAFAYAPFYVVPLLGFFEIELPLPDGPAAILILNWIAVLTLLTYMRLIEGRPYAAIGLTAPSADDIGWAFAFWGLSMGMSAAAQAFLPYSPSQGVSTLLDLGPPILAAMIATTAITEEVLYRGYSIEALTDLVRYRWLAAAISLSVFVTPHVSFFGPGWLLHHGAAPALLYALYLWRRNLWACMVLHGLGNAMILLPALGLVDYS